MLLIAHRGGTDRYPELTLAAARHSLEKGAQYVEMDIRFTKDDVPVISHDENAARLFGNPGKIREMTLAQFISLTHIGDNRCHPHTLEEVLESGIAPILFHIKEGGEPLARILRRIRAHRYEDKVVMGVVSSADVRGVKAFNETIKVLGFMRNVGQIDEFIESGADIIRLWEEWVDEQAVKRIQRSGKQVWVMAGSSAKGTIGCTTPDRIAAWKRMGVDGVLLDKIEKAKEAW